MALQIPSTFSASCSKALFPQRLSLSKRSFSLFVARSADNGSGTAASVAVEVRPETKEEESAPVVVEKTEENEVLESNGASKIAEDVPVVPSLFQDSRWSKGTWDVEKFRKDGVVDWDAVIDAGIAFL